MTTAIKRRRGTTTQHSTFTGLEGELTVDTTKETVVVHDGATAGGFPLLREDLSNNNNVATLNGTQTFSGTKTFSNTISGSISGNAATATSVSGGTASVTTLTTSSTVTHNAGTANGVAYLNGSKVLTTGNALTFDGTNLGFGGTGQRITGDFSNGTIANRVMFQTSTVNGQTEIGVITNGSGSTSTVSVYNGSDANNASVTRLGCTPTDSRLAATNSGTGTYLPMTFYTGGSERMRIDTSGNLGIGTSSPGVALDIGRDTSINQIKLKASNGNVDLRINSAFGAADVAAIGVVGGYPLMFFTSNSERMRIDSSGNVLVTNAGGGLGYGTGSGGTVTQATNKSTAVTLNKPTGQITMNNAALAAGASAAFQFNNSLISASDVVVCNPGNFGNYTAQVYFVTAGACGIRLTNISGGSLSEAVTINFAVIKGATS